MFVATLPYIGLIFCIALEHQKTADLLHGINELLRYLQGVTQTITCDNMHTAVTKANRYEPVFTVPCYQNSEHYGTTLSATRPGKPRNKAMVEKPSTWFTNMCMRRCGTNVLFLYRRFIITSGSSSIN